MAIAERTVGATQRSIDLLRDSELNKSTAFTEAEREAVGVAMSDPARRFSMTRR